jgi:uncharacterized membrane protein
VIASGLYDWLLLAHIVAATVWVGGGALMSMFATRSLREGPESVGRFVSQLRVTGPRFFAPAVVLVLALGIGLVLDGPGWSFGQLWVRLGLGLYAAAFILGVVFLSRAAIRAARAASEGDDQGAARNLQAWIWGYRLVLLLLLVTMWDMVFKPGP